MPKILPVTVATVLLLAGSVSANAFGGGGGVGAGGGGGAGIPLVQFGGPGYLAPGDAPPGYVTRAYGRAPFHRHRSHHHE